MDLDQEWQTYRKLDKNIALESYSYSFETHKFYDALKFEDRKQILNLYSDGENTVNIIAIKDVLNRPLTYTDIAQSAQYIVGKGLVPFIGRWKVLTKVYTGLSAVIDHGITDAEVLSMLKTRKQMCALRLSTDKATYFPTLF